MTTREQHRVSLPLHEGPLTSSSAFLPSRAAPAPPPAAAYRSYTSRRKPSMAGRNGEETIEFVVLGGARVEEKKERSLNSASPNATAATASQAFKPTSPSTKALASPLLRPSTAPTIAPRTFSTFAARPRTAPSPPEPAPSPSSPPSQPLGVGADIFWQAPYETRPKNLEDEEEAVKVSPPNSFFEDDDDEEGWKATQRVRRAMSMSRRKSLRDLRGEEKKEEGGGSSSPGLYRAISNSQPSLFRTLSRTTTRAPSRPGSPQEPTGLRRFFTINPFKRTSSHHEDEGLPRTPPRLLRKRKPSGHVPPHSIRPFDLRGRSTEDLPRTRGMSISRPTRRRSRTLEEGLPRPPPPPIEVDATDVILDIFGYDGDGQDVVRPGRLDRKKEDVEVKTAMVADWRLAVPEGGTSCASSLRALVVDDDAPRPTVFDIFRPPSVTSPSFSSSSSSLLSPATTAPTTPASPATQLLPPSPSILPSYRTKATPEPSAPPAPNIPFSPSSSIDYTAFATTKPLRLRAQLPPAVMPPSGPLPPPPSAPPTAHSLSFFLCDPSHLSATTSQFRSMASSPSIYSTTTDADDPFSLHVPVYSIPGELPTPPSPLSPFLPAPSPLRQPVVPSC
ncbi:hypothetical protein JCM8547_001060 [Rhodosporidiobolus lusitaniae]